MELDQLCGVVERVIYRGDDSGFTVFVLASKQTTTTVRGNLCNITPGQEITIQGTWTVHPKFGRQFEARSCQIILPTSPVGLAKYLGSGIIKGIGKVYAQKLVQTFGTRVLEVIDQEPHKLSIIGGIGPTRIERIIQGWKEQKAVAHLMAFLQDKGISLSQATKIHRTYGDQAVETIKSNPYRLAQDVWGIGFKTADAIAKNLGFDSSGLPRIKAGICHAISLAVANGNLYLEIKQLKEQSLTLLELENDEHAPSLKLALTQLYDEGTIKTVQRNDTHFVTLAQYYFSEYGVAQRIKILHAHASSIRCNSEQTYQHLRTQHTGIELNEDQQRAIMTALQHKITIVTGGPGTGKTTLLKSLITILEKERIQYKLAAPTGRAAKRINESTGQSASTLHRLLEFEPARMQFSRNERNVLEANMLIIDEASMIDVFLAHAILKALPVSAHLVLIGDIDQLPAVGAGNVLHDLINSPQTVCIRLTHVFRQAQNSLIVINAHRINKGQFPTTSIPDARKDFIWIREENPLAVTTHLKAIFASRLPALGFSPRDATILVPMNRGSVGTHKLNQELQELLNGNSPGYLTVGATQFRIGDRVMQIRNNYSKWIFNGDVGIIETVDTGERTAVVAFGNQLISYDYGELDELVLAYAVTVHKSQGSEYPVVIVPLFTQHFALLARNLVYTAFTRARLLCIFLGQAKALAIAIKNTKGSERTTFLTDFLMDTSDGSIL